MNTESIDIMELEILKGLGQVFYGNNNLHLTTLLLTIQDYESFLTCCKDGCLHDLDSICDDIQ